MRPPPLHSPLLVRHWNSSGFGIRYIFQRIGRQSKFTYKVQHRRECVRHSHNVSNFDASKPHFCLTRPWCSLKSDKNTAMGSTISPILWISDHFARKNSGQSWNLTTPLLLVLKLKMNLVTNLLASMASECA